MLESRELPERWSARRKSEIVLRLLRGEDLGELSREIQVPRPGDPRQRRASRNGRYRGQSPHHARRRMRSRGPFASSRPATPAAVTGAAVPVYGSS